MRRHWGAIALLLIGWLLAGTCSGADSVSLTIRFIDDPPYQHSWLPWVDDHLRFELTIKNLADSTIAFEKTTPCYDCNPRFFFEDAVDGSKPLRSHEFDALFRVSDTSYIDLAIGVAFIDTVDVAEWVSYDFLKGRVYQFWIEYLPFVGYSFKDTLRTAPIREKPLFSDTLEFTFE